MFLKRWLRQIDLDHQHYSCTYWDITRDCSWTATYGECFWLRSNLFRKMRNGKFTRVNIAEIVLHFLFMLLTFLDDKWPSLVTAEQDSPWRPRLMIQGAVFTGESIHHSTCDMFLLDICLNGVFSLFRTISENHTQWLIRLLDYISDTDVVFLESHELYYLPGNSFKIWPIRWKASLSLFWFNDIYTLNYDMC